MVMMRLLPALVLPSALVAAIPSPPVWPADTCTDKSLSIPSWVISEFQATDSGVSFHILNRASNYEGTVTCTGGSCTAAGNAALHVKVSVNRNNAEVAIDDTWSCSDKRDPITVHVTGTAIIGLTSSGSAWYPETLVRGSITSPVTLTPAHPDSPTGYDLDSCSAKTQAPSWTFTNTELRNITAFYINQPDGAWVLPGLYFYTTVTNDNTGYSVECNFQYTTDPKSDPGPYFFSCTDDVYNRVGTNLTWDTQTSTLAVDQTWYCIEDSDTNQVPSALSATGNVTFPFNCTTDPVHTLVIHCNNTEAHATGAVTARASDLPVFSLTDPPPTVGGCTVDTLTNPSWTLDTYRFFADNTSDPWHIDTFYMYFYLNPARVGLWTTTTVWYPMINTTNNNHTFNEAWVVENFDVQSQYKVYFVFDYGDNARIDLHQAWLCSDKDAAHPILFNATGSGHLDQPPCIPWNPEEQFCKDDSLTVTFAPTTLTNTLLSG